MPVKFNAHLRTRKQGWKWFHDLEQTFTEFTTEEAAQSKHKARCGVMSLSLIQM